MTPRQFAALAIVAAVSLTAAMFIYSARTSWTTTAGTAGKLFPSLAAASAKAQRIVITQGGTPLKIEKAGEQWKIGSPDGYPASNEKVQALLTALAGAELLEPKTRIASRYAVLDVDDPKTKNTNARLIKIEDASGSTLAEIIAGKDRLAGAPSAEAPTRGASGTYVRRPGDEQSWLASTNVKGGASLKDWADARVFETQTEKIKTLTVAVQGEAPYVVKSNADGSHELESIPAGKKVKYVNMIDNIIEAASFLDFTNVRKATGSTGGEAGTVTFETDHGLKIALNVRREKDAVWMTVGATGSGEAQKTAEDIKARATGWEFEITPSKADSMLKKQADLLENTAS